MSVHDKLMSARIMLQKTKLEKTGHNKFAGYKYFELGDFLPTVQKIFTELKLSGYVSYLPEVAVLTITDTEDGTQIFINSPMASAALKGAHDIQNLGAVQTYLRRYLWVTAMEIVEHDVLDASLGSDMAKPKPSYSKPVEKAKEAPKPAPTESTGGWTITAEPGNFEAVEAAVDLLLGVAETEEDVKTLFQKNRGHFDAIKDGDPDRYAAMMDKFKTAKANLNKE